VLGFLGVLFVLAALPRIQSLYSSNDPRISPLALLLKEHTWPGEQVLTNAPAIYNQALQLGYYAGRDVSYNPVSQIPELERAFAANGRRPFAFLLEGGAGCGGTRALALLTLSERENRFSRKAVPHFSYTS